MNDNLKDIRQDIFDIEIVPKVLYVYRGDTFELDLNLTISSSELNGVVLNCDGLPEATPLTLLETTADSSKWRLVLNKMQTLILAPKTHNFTITIIRTDGTELTLYKGIMAVNNRVHSNYSNNYYVAALLKQTAPTIADNDYLIGTMWVNVLTNRVYFLTSVVNNEAKWLDYAGLLDERDIRMDEVLDGTAGFTGVKIDDGNGNSAFIRYTHTNNNDYQVVDIIYPDGRIEQINEQFDNNFRSVVDVTLNSGHVLMSHGVTQGQQVVDAKLFDETSQDAYNVLGVVTVDGITKHSKSKATRLGIVTGIQSFFNTGIPYTEGQTLWARQGLLSNVAPSKPGLQVRMGVLINTQGSMDALICPHIFGKLADSSDVDMTGVQEGDVIEKRGELYKPTNRVTQLEATRELLENKAEDFTVVNQTKYPTVQAVKTELDKKVDKTTTIIGLNLQNNILLGEFRTALGNATQSTPGLLSAEDKTHLDSLVALLETSDGNNVVDTIGEILAIFQNYPEGADLVTALAGKVDKVEGMGLSTNDYTTDEKNKLSGIAAGAEVNVQSDWNQTDDTQDDYIKNKPAIPTKTSDLINDNEFITEEDLPPQYDDTDLKSRLSAIEEIIESIDGENDADNVINKLHEIVALLDGYAEGTTLVNLLSGKADTNHQHTKSEIIDFPTSMPPTQHNHDDRYYTETEVDTKLVGKADTNHNHDSVYVKQVEGKTLTDNNLTDALKSNYDTAYSHSQTAHAPSNAQANVIETVKVNGVALPVSSKAVDITIPDVDLTDYYTKTEIDTMIGDIETLLEGI